MAWEPVPEGDTARGGCVVGLVAGELGGLVMGTVGGAAGVVG